MSTEHPHAYNGHDGVPRLLTGHLCLAEDIEEVALSI
jgi:hypothetical protein